MNRDARLDVIRELRERARQMAVGGVGLDGEERLTLRRLLRGEGLARGALVEWQGPEGGGVATLALVVAGAILRRGGALVVIDEAGEFYPPAAMELGVPLERTLVVRPRDSQAGLWAWEQSLRSGAAAVTLGVVDPRMERYFVRLQLAAETGGSAGFLLQPAGRSGATKVGHRLRVEPLRGPASPAGCRRRWHVEWQHGRVGSETIEVELGDEAGDVRVVSELADSAKAACPAAG